MQQKFSLSKFLVFGFLLITLSFAIPVYGANPAAPINPDDNIQDPGDPGTAWGGCTPADSNCYVTPFGGDADFDTLTVNTNLVPDANDGAGLGTAALSFSDLFLASGSIINFNAGDVTLTHSADILAIAGGDLRVATAGTDSASVVTVGGTQTLTGKTLTAPRIADLGFLADANGNEQIILDTVASAVNELTIANAATGGVVSIATTGGDTDIALSINSKGADSLLLNNSVTGSVQIGAGAGTATPVLLITDTKNTSGDPTGANGAIYYNSNTSQFRCFENSAWVNCTGRNGLSFEENGAIILDTALSADGRYNGITRAGTAGATLAFGDLVYLDPTDSRWELCDANAGSGADGDCRGVLGIVVLAAAADGDPTTVLLHGVVRADTAFPSMTVNAPMYASETAGDITSTQPVTTDVVIKVIGFALTSDEIFFNPSNDYITHT